MLGIIEEEDAQDGSCYATLLMATAVKPHTTEKQEAEGPGGESLSLEEEQARRVDNYNTCPYNICILAPSIPDK